MSLTNNATTKTRAKHVTMSFDSVSQSTRSTGPFAQKTRLAIYHLSTFPSTIRPSSSSRFVMKSACVLRGILLSLDTNLHKVQAIIGSREANYFPDKITPTPFYYLLIFNVARAEVVKST